jgi:hypothetical protein
MFRDNYCFALGVGGVATPKLRWSFNVISLSSSKKNYGMDASMCNQCANRPGTTVMRTEPSRRCHRHDCGGTSSRPGMARVFSSPCISRRLAGNAKGETENQSVFERNGSLYADERKVAENRREPQSDGPALHQATSET